MFEPVHIRYSMKKALWGLVAGVPFTVMIFLPNSQKRWYWAVYLILVLLNNLYIVKAFFNRDIVLTIEDQGIYDRRLGNLHVPWERIESVSLHRGERIFLNLFDSSHLGWEEGWFSIFTRPISTIGKEGVLINARGLECDFDHIVDIVSGRMTYFRENRA